MKYGSIEKLIMIISSNPKNKFVSYSHFPDAYIVIATENGFHLIIDDDHTFMKTDIFFSWLVKEYGRDGAIELVKMLSDK